MTRRRKYGLLVLAIVAAAGCLTLGWWQLSRWESNAGSYQNLGYALQWPLFAGFCLYAYRKFIRYEQTPPQPPGASDAVTEIPAGLLPERPGAAPQATDSTLREYNAYLAELAKADSGADSADQNSADQNSAHQNSAHQNSADQNSADQNRTTA